MNAKKFGAFCSSMNQGKHAVEYYKAALESTPDAGFTVDAVSSDQASISTSTVASCGALGHDCAN